MLRKYSTFNEAYHSELRRVSIEGEQTRPILDPTSVGSHFGKQPRSTMELLGHGFCLTNPRARLAYSPARRIDLAFAIANTLWTLRGSDALDEIAAYNSRGRLFSSDGL